MPEIGSTLPRSHVSELTRRRTRSQLGIPSVSKAERGSSSSNGESEFECIALILQGGGALGAYQGGVYEALAQADIAPDWVGGISIGAITGAILAGNTPANRIAKLRGFWEYVTANPLLKDGSPLAHLLKPGGD